MRRQDGNWTAMPFRPAPKPASTVELSVVLPRAAALLHAIAGRLRERFLDLGVYDEPLAADFEDLARLAATLEALGSADRKVH